MMELSGHSFSRLLIIAGILLAVLGVLGRWAPGLLAWFGRLPGDIRLVRGEMTLLLPLTSMIVASIIVTAILNFVVWLGRQGT